MDTELTKEQRQDKLKEIGQFLASKGLMKRERASLWKCFKCDFEGELDVVQEHQRISH